MPREDSMDTLLIALAVIGSIFAVAFVFGTASERLHDRTGKDLGAWTTQIVMTGLFLLVGYGGLLLLRWSMSEAQVLGAVFGLVVLAIAGAFLYATWWLK
jgi:hypothetical protein